MNLHFCGPFHPQQFALPKTFIYHITMKPTNSKSYQKLIQCCKYFFSKNQIIVLPCLHYFKGGWKICVKKCEKICGDIRDMKECDFLNITAKFWITDVLDLQCLPFFLSNFISKIHLAEVKSFVITQQIISLKEFLFFALAAVKCTLRQCTVMDENNIPMQFESIVANLPNVKYLSVYFIPNAANISQKTVKELLKLPHFANIKEIHLENLTELFDIDTLLTYHKGTTDVCLSLYFGYSISVAFWHRLKNLVNEILETPSPTSYRIPLIILPGPIGETQTRLICRYFEENCP